MFSKVRQSIFCESMGAVHDESEALSFHQVVTGYRSSFGPHRPAAAVVTSWILSDQLRQLRIGGGELSAEARRRRPRSAPSTC